jgi:head-tail adaptor
MKGREEKGRVVGSYEHGKESWNFIKLRDSRNRLSASQEQIFSMQSVCDD